MPPDRALGRGGQPPDRMCWPRLRRYLSRLTNLLCKGRAGLARHGCRSLCLELAEEGGPDHFRSETGLPLAAHFSGLKIRWILENVPGVRRRAEAGSILFGNMDAYLVWSLTGGPRGGIHLTDCTNASRTQLMNLGMLDWNDELLEVLGVPRQMLPI